MNPPLKALGQEVIQEIVNVRRCEVRKQAGPTKDILVF